MLPLWSEDHISVMTVEELIRSVVVSTIIIGVVNIEDGYMVDAISAFCVVDGSLIQYWHDVKELSIKNCLKSI
jgi:hypothetical protein